MKFISIQKEIEAIQWTGENIDEVIIFCEGYAEYQLMISNKPEMVLHTGNVIPRGNWIIQSLPSNLGDFKTVSADEFENSYQRTD